MATDSTKAISTDPMLQQRGDDFREEEPPVGCPFVDVGADDQRRQDDAADQWRRDQDLEQGIRRGLCEDDRPVRGSDQRAALQRHLQGVSEGHGSASL